MGSVASMATLNTQPNDYAGAILIEGTIHDPDANVRLEAASALLQ